MLQKHLLTANAGVLLGQDRRAPELVRRRAERLPNPSLANGVPDPASVAAGFDVRRFDPARLREASRVPMGVEVWSPELMRKRLLRYSNPIVPNLADRQAWMLYDRLKVAAAANTSSPYVFFQNGTGTGTPPKPKEDTNLVQTGRLEDPQRFFITAVRLVFSSDMFFEDVVLFQKNYFIELWIGQKIYQEGPLPLFPGGAGVSGFTTRTAQSSWNNGAPDPRSINLLGEEGIWILQGQQFRVEMKSSVAATALQSAPAPGANILLVLDGILYRQVQ